MQQNNSFFFFCCGAQLLSQHCNNDKSGVKGGYEPYLLTKIPLRVRGHLFHLSYSEQPVESYIFTFPIISIAVDWLAHLAKHLC